MAVYFYRRVMLQMDRFFGVATNLDIRNSKEYKDWRNSVFAGNDYTCQRCQQWGGRLQAHHIYNFADNPEQRLDVDNGITLCKKCHKEFHKIYKKRNTNLKQLEEFLDNEPYY